MDVSVVLATYNGSRHLQEQLASLASQTLQPAELIVSDDGSTDDTLAQARSFAARAPFPVKILEKERRLGFSDNFLYAAERSTHGLVAFCDQDDVWIPYKLELCAQRIRDDDSLIALHTLTVTDACLTPTAVHTQNIVADQVYEPLALDPFVTGWGNAMVFKRQLLEILDRRKRPRQPFEPERPLSHDTWIYMLAAALGRVSHISAPLILYRQHPSNALGVAAPKRQTRLAKMIEVDMARVREQAAIDRSMVQLFNEVVDRRGPFAEQALLASRRFATRNAVLEAKAGIFLAPSLSSRLKSYREYHGLLISGEADTEPAWLGSRLKSLLLGVSGFELLKASRG